MEILSRLSGDSLETLWRLQPLSGDPRSGDFLETLCRLAENSLETLWRLSGSLQTLCARTVILRGFTVLFKLRIEKSIVFSRKGSRT